MVTNVINGKSSFKEIWLDGFCEALSQNSIVFRKWLSAGTVFTLRNVALKDNSEQFFKLVDFLVNNQLH